MSVPSDKVCIDARLNVVVAEVRAELAKNTTQIVKWLVGLWFASIVLIISAVILIVHGAVNNAMPIATVAAPAAQPPIIIQVPLPVWVQQGAAPAPQP